ncbi:toxin-activating lysine-acyltransferase [uncultured Hyphomicrobium sp.]|uniref:toxin-activating lysine-acyltransferase n=1 Tax=uncultured Hyphomicrobium sp. TaxID=194373 RepID=UPI0025D8C91E|nr:toxin-activating lysine-acyltransferase [uncultured Hyphomicrobium sp.]
MFFRSKTNKPKETANGAAIARDSVKEQAVTAASPRPDGTTASAPSKKALGEAKAYSRGVIQAFGAVMAVCCRSKSHRGKTLAEIEEKVAPAVLSGQFSLAEATHTKDGLATPVAAVLWASVSENVDRRLSSSATTTLKSEDWKSGNIIWIVDVVGDNRILKAMVKTLRENAWKGRLVKVRTRNASGKLGTRILQNATA